jgi:Glycosyltransferase family 87
MTRDLRERIRWQSGAGLGLALASAAWFLAQPFRALRHLDSALWDPIAAARILGTGSRCIYSCEQTANDQASAFLHITLPPGTTQFLEPPPVAFILQPLSGLDAHVTLAIFMTFSIACVAGAGWLLYRHFLPGMGAAARLTVVVLALTSLPATNGLRLGQWGPVLILPAVGAALLLRRDRRLLAGLCLSILLLKPQLIWMLPAILLVARQWRVLAGLTLGGAGWLAGSILILGFGRIMDWPNALLSVGGQTPDTNGLPGLVAYVTSSATAGTWCWAALGVATAAAIWIYRERLRERSDLLIGLGVAISLATAPHVFWYDYTLLALPLCLWARRSSGLVIATIALVDLIQIPVGPATDGFLEHLVIIGPVAATFGLWTMLQSSRPEAGATSPH